MPARVALLAAVLGYCGHALGQTPNDGAATSRKLLDAHNRERAAEKLGPLTMDDKLSAAAKVQAVDMAGHAKMSHEGSDGSTPAERIKRQEYRAQSTGENVARGQRTVAEVMSSWMNSPHHRENILGKYTQFGTALAKDGDGQPYWCVTFGTPWPTLEPTAAAADLVAALNRERDGAGKPALKAEPKLADAARRFAEALAKDEGLEKAPDLSKEFNDGLKRSGYKFGRLAQTAATGQPGAAEVLAGWMASPANKDNLLGDYADAGAGLAVGASGRPYWCLILAKPLGD